MKLITLQEWAENTYSVKFGAGTLNKWARDGLLEPAAQKIGNRWMVHPETKYIEKTIEAQRTEHANKVLQNMDNSNTVLNDRLLGIINNGTQAA